MDLLENMHRKIEKITDEEHKHYHRRVFFVLLLTLIILFGGAAFYYYIEQWRFLDSLYFSATTITTVGYGDLTPQTNAGKLFTIIYIFLGVGIVLYSLSLFAAHFVEVREEFWLEKLGKIKLEHPLTWWGKIKKRFF